MIHSARTIVAILLTIISSLALLERRASAQPANGAAVEEKLRGSLTGRFLFDGELPKPKPGRYSSYASIELAQPIKTHGIGRPDGVELWYRMYLEAGTRPDVSDRSLLVNETGGIANILVWVVSKDIPWTSPPDFDQSAVKITLKNGNYSPRVSVVTIGQPLLVKNQDSVEFNFHLHAIKNRSVNVMLARQSAEKPLRVTLTQPDRHPMKYQSDCGPWAEGYVFVHSNPYAAVTNPDGSFTIPDLPVGEWEFRAWHEAIGWVKNWPNGLFTHKIKATENNLGTIKLSPDLFK